MAEENSRRGLGARWQGHYGPDLLWSGPDVVPAPNDDTLRWLREHATAYAEFLDQVYDIDCLPLPLKHACEAAAVALQQAMPLFNRALSLPPSERLKATRAPRYFELTDALQQAETQLLLAIWAARTQALSAWLRGEGDPQEPKPQKGTE